MRPLPIRLRLTLWYFSVLAAGLLAFALFTLAALNHAVHSTVDNQLRSHIAAVRKIINEDQNRNLTALRADLDEDVELAPDLTLIQIWDQDLHTVYRSAPLDRMHAPNIALPVVGHPVTHTYHHHLLRILIEDVSAPNAGYTVMVAIPIHDFAEAIGRVESTFWIAIPLLLVLLIAGGYWIAGRALSPIGSMIAAAESIRPEDMSTRLSLPPADDELRRLALTLNRMLGRLQAAFERITRFTADASHELRTPVALMRTRTEVLLRRSRSAEEYRCALEANLTELENTSTLLENLMLLARADAGAETLHFADVNLTELVRATAISAQPLAEARHIEWVVQLSSLPVHTHADEAALRRLLLVLLDNAVKYTPEGGCVQISLQTNEISVVIEVRDTGIGVPAEVLPHIFDRFYRGEPSRATDGAGLGLSIGQWIAEKHGGKITVENRPSGGSRFAVTLPRVRR